MPRRVLIDYTNWKGERAKRLIVPHEKTLRFTGSEYHPEAQWVFDALDVERNVIRTFAVLNVHSWGKAE